MLDAARPTGVAFTTGAAFDAARPPCRGPGVAAPDAIVEVDEVVGGEGAVGPGVVGILAYAHPEMEMEMYVTSLPSGIWGFHSMICLAVLFDTFSSHQK